MNHKGVPRLEKHKDFTLFRFAFLSFQLQEQNKCKPVLGLEVEGTKTFQELREMAENPQELDENSRRILFGDCIIDVPIHSLPYLLFTEILNPFYVI